MKSTDFAIREQLQENLRKWFKEKWVRFGPDGKIRGACARGDDSEGKPKCLPQAKAHALGKKGRKYAAAKKRREDPNPERRGPAKNVATKKKTNEGYGASLSDIVDYLRDTKPNMDRESFLDDMYMYVDATYGKPKADRLFQDESSYDKWYNAYLSKQGVAEGLNEMDKSAPQPGRDGKVSHSTYGSRDKKGSDYFKGKEAPGKAITAKQMAKDALDILKKQGVAEGFPQPGESSGKAKQFNPNAKIQTREMTLDQILSSVKGIPYVNDVIQDWDAKDYSWSVTKKVIEYAQYLQKNPQSVANLPPLVVIDGKLNDGAHRLSAITLLQKRMDPKNPLWKQVKLKVNFGTSADVMSEQGVAEAELDEACWKGYHKEGNKKMFGKTYPNCVKNTNEEQLDEKCWDTHKQVGMKNKGGKMVPNCVPKESVEEGHQQCPECGGPMFSELLINEKKDACYYKVKSRYKVWPSAYASGALVKCRKKGASNWGTGGKKNESAEQLDELSPETLARYKKAAGADASKADKEGDFERGNKRFSGIVRATKKEFDKKSGVMEGISQLEEKWSQKYKNSINCSNPKGFSQRAHCQGKKKK